MDNPKMAASECGTVLTKLILAFPNLSGDADRCAEVARKLEAFTFPVASQAVDEYVDKSGDQWLNLTRLMVVMDRVRRQHLELEATMERRENIIREQRKANDMALSINRADELIRGMDDEQLMGEWGPLLMKMTGKAREWADKWTPAQVRTNLHFRQHIAESLLSPHP